jgi:cytochrome c5
MNTRTVLQRIARLTWLGTMALVGCGDGGGSDVGSVSPPVRDVDALLLAAARVALPPPVDPAAALPEPESEGAQLVQRYCTACHAAPTPAIHSATDWPRVARRMWLRMDGLPAGFAIERPTSAERTVVLRYLSRHALRTSGAALPEGEGRNAFVEVCGRCHELPDVRTHAAEDWGAVVARMQERMVSMLGAGMRADEQSSILAYLVAAARAE